MQQQFDERNRDLIVNIDGQLVHRDQAGVSPFDGAVQGGDAVWEGLRLYGGRIRLTRSRGVVLDICRAQSIASEVRDLSLTEPYRAGSRRSTPNARQPAARGSSTDMIRIITLTALCALAAGGCAASRPPADAVKGCGAERPVAAGGERATLWIQTSAEFRAATEIIYRSATAALAPALADRGWSAEPSQTGESADLPPAVVMDIDDTVLDNSAVQAQMYLERTCPREFAAVWDAWVRQRAAPAVPGAVAFLRAARTLRDAQGRPLRVFLITNRECSPREGSGAPCPQQDDTLANLRSLGLDAPTLADDLMLKGEQPGWGSEKLSRRRLVAGNYRILLNVGDDLADFIPGARNLALAAREEARCARRDWWGQRWFLIPNPMYGSWLRVLGDDPEAALTLPPPEACGTGG